MKFIRQFQVLTAAFGLALIFASSGVQAVDASPHKPTWRSKKWCSR